MSRIQSFLISEQETEELENMAGECRSLHFFAADTNEDIPAFSYSSFQETCAVSSVVIID